MKKVITLSSAALAALTLVAVAAPAAVASADSVDANNWASKGTVSFTAPDPDTELPGVTDPENPGVTPEPGLPSVPGNFAIDYASDFDFGTHTIQGTNQTYYAKLDSKAQAAGYSGTNFASMHDLRGTGDGWTMTVTQASQFNNGSADLTNATLTFSGAKGVNSGGGTEVPTAKSSYTLVPGQAQQVLSDDSGTVGNYAVTYGATSDYKGDEVGGPISLYVPSGSAKASTYTTTLNWNLASVPQ